MGTIEPDGTVANTRMYRFRSSARSTALPGISSHRSPLTVSEEGLFVVLFFRKFNVVINILNVVVIVECVKHFVKGNKLIFT